MSHIMRYLSPPRHLPLLFALGRIRSADIHFGRACGIPDHRGSIAPPRAWYLSLFKNRVLLTFAGCVFLFQLANASMLPLAGEALVYRKAPLSSLIVSALIIVPQGIVALMAPWAGRRAKTWGRRPLLLCRVLRFACPPAVVFLDHQSNNSHCRSGPRWDKWNVTRRARGTNHCRPDNSGRFNLAQGLVGLLSGVGASLSTTLSSLVAARLGTAAGFLGIAAVALAAALLLWLLMPETNPSNGNQPGNPSTYLKTP
jgi:hypothetical protein